MKIKQDNSIDLSKPIKLQSTRAWRTYLGGKQIDELHGKASAMDSNYPEEWLMSTVIARNSSEENTIEGLSFLDNSENSLLEVIEQNPKEVLGFDGGIGVLVKLIDSAERLTVQVHPTRENAKRLFGSEYGKTECWHILGKRNVDGENPCIYLGFKEGITRETWKKYFEEQDITKMLDCLHKIDVEVGDTYLIKGGIPHAIGAGCFLTEIQEPTDYTIRTERITPSGLHISDLMCHQGLGFERMFDCFSYKGEKYEDVIKNYRIEPQVHKELDYAKSSLIDYTHTPMFKMESIEIKKNYTVSKSNKFSGIYVLFGNGELCGKKIHQGDQFFLSAQCQECEIKGELKILRYYGAKENSK